MKFAGIAALALLAASPSLIFAGSPAAAQTVSDCQVQISNLRSALATVAITGKNADKDRSGLLGKADSASTELGKAKFTDAAKKLSDLRVKVQELNAAGKISSGDASSLTAQIDSAIACVNGLSAT